MELTPAVPWTGRVWTPVPRAGSDAAEPTLVATAGWEVTTAGWLGMEVATPKLPVTTPLESVWVVKEVWGWASMEVDCLMLAGFNDMISLASVLPCHSMTGPCKNRGTVEVNGRAYRVRLRKDSCGEDREDDGSAHGEVFVC